ncbi:Serpin-ZXA [Hordeum vulgare]|nr:Serpin-ZXA [Hordeum vulgare]
MEAQLLSFLGVPSAADLAAFGRPVAETVLADQANDDSGPCVLFGGGVWLDASCGALKKAFWDVAAESYKSQARTVDFADDVSLTGDPRPTLVSYWFFNSISWNLCVPLYPLYYKNEISIKISFANIYLQPEEAVEIISDWVKKATNSLITSMFSRSDINADTALVVANAVYFKGLWRNPFKCVDTSSGKFHLLDGSCVTAKFMWKGPQSQFISCVDGFKVLKLPYRGPWKPEADADAAPLKRRRGRGAAAAVDADNTQFNMFFFLQEEQRGITNMVDMITAAPSYLPKHAAGRSRRGMRWLVQHTKQCSKRSTK